MAQGAFGDVSVQLPFGFDRVSLNDPVFDIIAGIALLVVILVLLFVIRFLWTWRQVHRAALPGKERSSQETSQLPRSNFRRDGTPGDPINVMMIGSEAQIGAAFASAGWYRADEITFITSLRITFDAIFARKYSTAPVSSQFLYGRKQDAAFEQPGRNVRERDHARFWKTTQKQGKRDVWVGAATRDIRVALSPKTHLPTHLIEHNVDHERDFLAEDLSATGWVILESMTSSAEGVQQRLGGDGYGYETDGCVVMLTLANIPVLPFAQQIRGRPAANFIKRVVAPLLRRRLPEEGRERGHRVRQRRAEEAAK